MSEVPHHPNAISVQIIPGLILVSLLSGLAWGASQLTGLPAVITALVLGLCFSPLLARLPRADPGVRFAAEPLMKIAVACLGAGVNIALLMMLGWPVLLAIIVIMGVTVATGLWFGRLLGRTARFAMLSAGAVAICGASAAVALCCALPASKTRERDLSVVIIGVSLLSAAGVLLYPLLTQALSLNEAQSGFVLGASLHNVAQAVAAGFSVSEPTGETATLVKMMRVTLLAPCVMIVAYAFRTKDDADAPARVRMMPPAFLIAFLLLMVAGSAGWIPAPLKTGLALAASSGLILAMTAIGLATPVAALVKTDRRAILLILLQTGVMLGGVLAVLPLLDL